MIDPDALPYEVGKGKPPKAHQFKKGNRPKGHRRRGQVGLLQRLRCQLEEAVPGQDRTYADALVQRIAAEALRNPVRCWPILKALVDREPGPAAEPPATTAPGDAAGTEGPNADSAASAPSAPEDGPVPAVSGASRKVLRSPAEPRTDGGWRQGIPGRPTSKPRRRTMATTTKKRAAKKAVTRKKAATKKPAADRKPAAAAKNAAKANTAKAGTAKPKTPAPRAKLPALEVAAPPKKPSGDPTLLEVAQGYLASLEAGGHSATTVSGYRMELRRALAALGETTPVGQLTVARVEEYFRSPRVTTSRSGEPLSPRGIAKTRRVLRLALLWALSAGWVREVPLPQA